MKLTLHPPLLTDIDEWIKDLMPGTKRPEAIRKMLIHYLELGEPMSKADLERMKKI